MSIAMESAKIDQLRALLSDALVRLEQGTPGKIETIIDGLEQDFRSATDMGEKFVLHAALVGVTTTMQLSVEASQ